MRKTYGFGVMRVLGVGVCWYFLVVYLLPMLGKYGWIWT